VDFQGQAAHEKSWAVRNRYMLQRKKAIIADQMPEKKDQVVFCELSPLQVRAYKCAFMFVCVDTFTSNHLNGDLKECGRLAECSASCRRCRRAPTGGLCLSRRPAIQAADCR